jgi:hypothetical protein
MKSTAVVFLSIVVCLMLNCNMTGASSDDDMAGTGSETTNRLVINTSSDALWGTAKQGMTVSLFSTDYVPGGDSGYAASCIADGAGHFGFFSIEEGAYNVLAIDSSVQSGAFIADIPISPVIDTAYFSAEFEKTGAIDGTVYLNSTPIESAFVYIKGLPYSDSTDESGRYDFNMIPHGVYIVESEVIMAIRDSNTVYTSIYRGTSDTVVIDPDSTAQDVQVQLLKVE